MIHRARCTLRPARLGSATHRLNRTSAQRKLFMSKELFLPVSTGYAVEPLSLTHPVVPLSPVSPYKPVLSKPEYFEELEEVLNVDIIQRNKPIKSSPTVIPIILKSKLSNVSDVHLKLSHLLSYEQPYRLDHNFVEDLLKTSFREENIVKIYRRYISSELLLKLVTFYTSQKNFTRVAEVYYFLYESKMLKFVDIFNNRIFSTLGDEQDLHFGVYNIMKHLYILSDANVDKFEKIFNFLNIGNSLKRKTPITSFTELLQSVQLETVIHSSNNVTNLPQVYFETKFANVDLLLVLKLIEVNEIEKAFELIETKNLQNIPGLFYRLLGEDISSEYFKENLLNVMKKMRNYPFRPIDAIKWRKYGKKGDFMIKSLNLLQNNESLVFFKNQYLYQLLKSNEMTNAIKFVKSNMDSVNSFDFKILSTVLLANKDISLFRKVSKKLNEEKLKELVSICIKRTVTNKSLPTEKKFTLINGIVKNNILEESDVSQLCKVLPKFNHEQNLTLFNRMKFASDELLHSTLNSLKSINSTNLSIALLKENRIDISAVSKSLAQEYTKDEIIKYFSKSCRYDFYQRLNVTTTKELIKEGRINDCETIQETLYHCPKSKQLILEHKIISRNYPPIDLSTHQFNPVIQLYFETLQRLVQNEDITMTNGFKRILSTLYRSGKINNKLLSIELLRHLVKQTKRHNGDPKHVKTERLCYFIQNCEVNGVEKNVIRDILYGNYTNPSIIE